MLTRGHLVSQSTASTMQHNANLTRLLDAHLFGVELVVDFVDHLDFRVVVACSKCSQLI